MVLDFTGWKTNTPRENLAPVFSMDDNGLTVDGNGKQGVFGYFSKTVPVHGGKTYKLSVLFKANDVSYDINLYAVMFICWKKPGMEGGDCPMDGICDFKRDGEYIRGEFIGKTRDDIQEAEIMLGLRYAADMSITYKSVLFEESEAAQPRMVKVTATKYNSSIANGDVDMNRVNVEQMVRQASEEASDLVLLPEFCFVTPEEIPNGETSVFLSELAVKHKINICAGVMELASGLHYNTAVLFDRQGGFVGKYRKTHIYFPEGIWGGTTPGDEFPVFDLDIGRVGVIICYDSWYAETARIMALKGAELVLFPNAGYEEKLLPARAIDNCVYIVCSSMHSPAAIYDTMGERLACVAADRQVASVTTQIDLSVRRIPHANAGGNLNPGSAGRRCARNSVSDRIYKEILTEMNSYLNSNEPYTWL